MTRDWRSWALGALVSTLTMLDCHAATHVMECERLQHYSCDCFGTCQTDDHPAIESADPDTCSARLRHDFAQWQICASGIRPNGQRCDENCMLGWGICAFDVYREAGLAPMNLCEETGG
jgi:hypothetical protein